MQLTTPMSRAFDPRGEVIAFERQGAPRVAAIRLLLAHQQGLARAGLRALLERDADISVVGEASRGEDAIALAEELLPDIVVIDSGLLGFDVLQATRQLTAGCADTTVLMLGACDSDDVLFGALRAGASGFLVKDTEPAELVRAIHSLSDGHGMLSPSVTRRLIDEIAAQPDRHRPVPELLEELTQREREVMGLVAMGLSNLEIAERLVVSPATVKTHVSRAMLKLHARDRAQLVVLAYQSQLIEPRRHGEPLAPSALQAVA